MMKNKFMDLRECAHGIKLTFANCWGNRLEKNFNREWSCKVILMIVDTHVENINRHQEICLSMEERKK